MKVKNVSYSQSRESVNSIGLKRWDKVGLEGELQDGDIYEDCLKELKTEADQFLSRNIPNQETYNEVVQTKQSPKEQRIGVFVEDIMSCGSIPILETYKLIVKKDPLLQAAYSNRLKELTP